jgi:hypothetical protein
MWHIKTHRITPPLLLPRNSFLLDDGKMPLEALTAYHFDYRECPPVGQVVHKEFVWHPKIQ